MRKIVVVSYDPRWPAMYRQEAAAIARVFGDELIAIHHIGSTSVPGLSAKPVIDIMPVVRSIDVLARFDPAMVELGYEPKGENGIPGRRFYTRGEDDVSRTHNVHAYAQGHPEVTTHVAFRDHLIAYPDDAQRYASLKAELAAQFPRDIRSYSVGKDAFIREILRAAASAGA